jgi:UDP-N-acetylglucosamine 1-carboxyvinyltransferase
METVTSKLLEMGVDVEVRDSEIAVRSDGAFKGVSVRTLPYPGFPTDMQPQFGAIMCLASGISTITESVWESRFQYVDELLKMGADITVEGNRAIINGVARLKAAEVTATDLRAGAALIIAGLNAEGETKVAGVEKIERGYDDIVGKLKSIGADVELIEE